MHHFLKHPENLFSKTCLDMFRIFTWVSTTSLQQAIYRHCKASQAKYNKSRTHRCIHVCAYVHTINRKIGRQKNCFGRLRFFSQGFPGFLGIFQRFLGGFGGLRQASAGLVGPDPCSRSGWGRMSAQDRQHRPQERPKTANIGPKSGPRPPTFALTRSQDRQLRP